MRNLILITVMTITFSVFAKNVVTVFKVEAQCEMCKEKIEKALDIQGISYAEWNVSNKMVTVKYNDAKMDEMKIHRVIADLGYATEKMTANKEAQNSLAACCKPNAAPMKANAEAKAYSGDKKSGDACATDKGKKGKKSKKDKCCDSKADSKSCSGKDAKTSCGSKSTSTEGTNTSAETPAAPKSSSCAPAAAGSKPCCSKAKS